MFSPAIFPVLIVALFAHHYYIHGRLYDDHDFKNAVMNLIGSHEGIIVMLVIMLIGALLWILLSRS